MDTEQHHADTRWVATSFFKRLPESVACARNWAMQVYAEAGGPLPDICELLVSEVATNAVVHGAGSEYRVSVRADFSIEVWDASPVEPQHRQADASATTGRGLELLKALADYKVRAELGGKTVSFMPRGW